MISLVTGGAGFIGSTLVDRLLHAGHEVHVVDDFTSGNHANLEAARRTNGDRLHVHELDIRDPSTVDAVAAVKPEVVFHLAAQMDVRVSVARPVHDASINVIGSLHVLEGARLGGSRKVVFASSGGTIYGEPDPSVLPVDETHPQHPVSPYGVAKKVVSDYLFAFQSIHGLDFTSLALANVYGPRQDPHGEAGVVAIFAGHLLDAKPCRIFGDGEQTRDFVYVDDVVDAFVRAADAGKASGLVVNIGTGVETSVNELYAAMAEAAGIDAPAHHEPARAGELARSALATGLAHAELGWVPTTDLPTGALRTLDWFRQKRA
jgi:UDP-glucose 4-epimerase